MAYGLPDWLTGSSTPASQPATKIPRTQDGGFVAPDRNQRELCYESRDLFFACLDRNNILDAVKEDERSRLVCPKEVTDYERDCARSWIKYFKEKRVFDHNRDLSIKKIQEDDAAAIAKAKAERGSKGGWFS